MSGSAEQVELAVARAIWLAGDTVIDVRTAEEYARGHVPGAINVPVDRVMFRAKELPTGQVLTVCSLGNRSWRAAQMLAASGREALSLTGGTKGWVAAGLPLATGPEPGDRRLRRRWWRR